MRKITGLTLFCLLMAVTTTACTPVTAKRGNMLELEQLQQVEPGVSTRSDVLRTLGSPTTQSTFNPDIWYYVGQVKEKRGILDPQVVDERVFVVTFNEEGVLQAIEEATGQGENIPYARAKTPTHGNEFTFMQQLLGNLGRFNTPKKSPTQL